MAWLPISRGGGTRPRRRGGSRGPGRPSDREEPDPADLRLASATARPARASWARCRSASRCPASQWIAFSEEDRVAPVCERAVGGERELPTTTSARRLRVRPSSRPPGPTATASEPGPGCRRVLLDRAASQGFAGTSRPSPPADVSTSIVSVHAVGRLLGLRDGAGERKDDRKALFGERPHDRVAAVVVGEDGLGAHHAAARWPGR